MKQTGIRGLGKVDKVYLALIQYYFPNLVGDKSNAGNLRENFPFSIRCACIQWGIFFKESWFCNRMYTFEGCEEK